MNEPYTDAAFCRQCSIEVHGFDRRQLADLTSKESWAKGYAAEANCDGCGRTLVDPNGTCLGCSKHAPRARRDEAQSWIMPEER